MQKIESTIASAESECVFPSSKAKDRRQNRSFRSSGAHRTESSPSAPHREQLYTTSFSPNRVAPNKRAQVREKLCFAEGFLQDGCGLHHWQFSHRQAGDDNDGDILIVQASDQAAGQLAPSEMEVDKGYVRRMLGEQPFGLCRSRGWSGHVSSQELEQPLHGVADTPGILDK
jgi:hypothetical protein